MMYYVVRQLLLSNLSMTRSIISNGSRSVLISPNNGGYFSILRVNNGETVVQGKSHSTEKGARKWAASVLAK